MSDLWGSIEGLQRRKTPKSILLEQAAFLREKTTFPLTIYPVELVDSLSSRRWQCVDEAEFISNLKDVLTSEKTREVIAGLLSQIDETEVEQEEASNAGLSF